jgi:Uma2 family endonuclease
MVLMQTKKYAKAQDKVYYPDSTVDPIGETEIHVLQILALFHTLRMFYRKRDDVYVGANMCLYYVEGDPRRMICPDVFVVLGVDKFRRRTYKVWEEGKVPDVIFEITSASTRLDDLGAKRGLYEALGVSEYFLFDPLQEYLKPSLQGYRLKKGHYARITGSPLTSQVMQLELRVEDGQLRLYDISSGARLRTPDEEYERGDSAEAENERLRAELAKLKGDSK